MKILNKIKSKLPFIKEERNSYKYYIIGNKNAYHRILSNKEKVLINNFQNNDGYKRSYSQDGEDMLLASLYDDIPNYSGFYIDIGAHDPIRFSNTQYFYEKGWRGINIDATPGSMIKFFKLRPYDINIECGISDNNKKLLYYCFEEPALNSFNSVISEERKNNGWKIKEKLYIQTRTINDILRNNLPVNQKIDFINIDIEGMEFDIIKTFDFNSFSPKYFLIEDLKSINDYQNISDNELSRYLKENKYSPKLKSKRTTIYSRDY